MPPSCETLWSQYCAHIQKWFYQPDLECLRILTANLYAHIHLNDPPAWLFIVGPSGTGKTKLGIMPYAATPRTWAISDITPAGLMSTDNSKRVPVHHGLLIQSGNPGNAIWLFEDFTTLLSKDSKEFSTLMGRLRKVHDGTFARDMGQVLRHPWTGKVTCHVATTSSIEDRLATERDFGERFLILRWPAPRDPFTALSWARAQNGHQAHILSDSQTLMTQLLTTPPTIDPSEVRFSPEDTAKTDALIWLAAQISTTGSRDGRHRLMSIGEANFPSRIAQSIQTIVKGHAMLFSRSVASSEELSLTYRLILDTIPAKRLKLLKAIPSNSPIDIPDLRLATNIPKTSLTEDLEVLVHAGVIENIDNIIAWSKPFKELMIKSDITAYLKTNRTMPTASPMTSTTSPAPSSPSPPSPPMSMTSSSLPS